MLVLRKTKPRKNNKSKSKKQRTFTSSEFSLPQDRQNFSTSELFRNDMLKKKAQPKPNKSQKQLGATKKRTKSKSKFKLDKCETYEVIPYKNSLNSEIVFSNEDTKRQRTMDDSSSDQVAIRVNQEYVVEGNRQLRISIKKEYQKKNEAAIKIQKVFRGFLTRKILLKYVTQEHRILSERLAHHRSESVSQHSSYFAEKSQNQSKRRVLSEQQGVYEYSNQQENVEDSESEDEMNTAIYRHHDPIYLHADNSDNLYSEQQEDFNENTYFPIMEVPAEYIDSRKSSGQQSEPRNKLSRPNQPQIEAISQEPPLTPNNQTQNDEKCLTKTEKKGQKERSQLNQDAHNNTLKLQDDGVDDSGHPFFETIDNEATMKEKDSKMKKKSISKIIESSQSADWQKLKELQVNKWSQIIELVQSQISNSCLSNDQMSLCMKKIMDMSIKNKKMLQLSPSMLHSDSQSSLYLEKSIPKIDSTNKLKVIKAERQYLNHYEQFDQHSDAEEIKIENKSIEQDDKFKESIQPERKKQVLTLTYNNSFFESHNHNKQIQDKGSDVPVSFHSPISSFENTGQMKKFLAGNIQEEHIDEMLKLRQQTLKKRQFEEMRQLNKELDSKSISQEEFVARIENITTKFAQQKICIEKTKEDISKGYIAAMRLTKQAFKDAKKLGYNLPVSRSLEGIRYKSPLMLEDIVIDELVKVKRQDNRQFLHSDRSDSTNKKLHEDSDQESSDLEFTEEELKRFRRAQPYDIELAEEIADMGRNVMINEQLFRQQQMEQDQNILMKTQHVFRQIFEVEQQNSTPPRTNPRVDQLSEIIYEWIIYEVVGELLIKPLFSEKLIDKNHFFRPRPVSDKERLKFMELLERHFPRAEDLNTKLNQKICPLPTELLRCMRIDFSQQDDDDNSYEQIGKYEFIIGQDICNDAIRDFLKEIESETPEVKPALEKLHQFAKQYNFNERVVRYIQQREKYISNRKNHTKQLRWEVLNIQIHCIFDAWNQELIFLRSQKAGYSGIGLNELSLSIRDHNCLVPMAETMDIIEEGKKRLINNMAQSSPALIFPAAIPEEDEQQLEKDSRWIFYADEALSYGLELVYLIEEEIFSEMGKQLRKRMLQFFAK